MIKRAIQNELRLVSTQYPTVTIIGPRQSGKTTLTKSTFEGYSYVNLELPDNRNLAVNDPNAFFARFRAPLVIDEVQRAPELLSYIQVIVDENNENGQFILTGSNQLRLNASITQSLAGRTAILKLLPFSISELQAANILLTRDEYISKGFLPRIYDKNQDPFKAYGNYFETYVEKDLRQQINLRNLSHFEAFLKLLAGRIGSVVNLNTISNDIGVSSTTLSEWLSILETSFIIHRIYPYLENFGKRVVKSPKVYFSEIGLASYLLGIRTPEHVNRDPLLGGLFENLVVNELIKCRYNKGLPHGLHYFRDSNGNEVDLVFVERRELVPIEIKAAMTFNERMVAGIHYFNKITPKAKKGWLIYAGSHEYESDQYNVLNFTNASRISVAH